MLAVALAAAALAAPVPNVTRARLESCTYTAAVGPTVSSRTSTIQLIEFGDVRFVQDCQEAEARGPGLLNLTHLGTTSLVPGEMAKITVSFVSCTLAWPSRYGEIFLDFRGDGRFERLVDAVGGTRDQTMGSPFTFHFRVPADAASGASRLRVVTYTCHGCFREESLRLNPCHAGEDNTVADLAVQIEQPPARGLDRLKLLLPPLRGQATEVEAWIDKRVKTVLPALMLENGVEFWVLVQREYAEDTVWRSIESPTRVNARRRTVVVFKLEDGEVEMKSFVSAPSTLDPAGPWSSEEFWGPIRDHLAGSGVVAVNKDVSVPKAFTDGAHAGELKAFTDAMGETVAARMSPAPPLPTYFLALRLPEQLPRYRDAMELSHGIIAEAMSRAVITPGDTTCEDVSWWMWEAGRSLGFPLSFKPSFGVQREGSEGTLTGDTVIQRGDFLWCDLGLIVMNLWTDTQHMGYVLKEGESAPPAGLLAGLAQTNRLQDIVMAELQVGRTGNEVLLASVAAMEAADINGLIYSHPTGDHMHASGPSIGLVDLGNQEVPVFGQLEVRAPMWFAVELSATMAVPEWGNQVVEFRQEEDAVVVSAGQQNEWVKDRQTTYWLVE